MKLKKVRTTDGKTITRYIPESPADIDRLNEMIKDGTLGKEPKSKPVVQ
jgi:hypothetical protein